MAKIKEEYYEIKDDRLSVTTTADGTFMHLAYDPPRGAMQHFHVPLDQLWSVVDILERLGTEINEEEE